MSSKLGPRVSAELAEAKPRNLTAGRSASVSTPKLWLLPVVGGRQSMAETCAPQLLHPLPGSRHLLGTLPVTAPGPLPREETLEGPVLSEEPTLGQTNVSRILGCVPSLAYMVAPGEREKDPQEPGRAPLPTHTVLGRAPLTWLGPKVSPGPPTAAPLPHPPTHQATDRSLTSPRRGLSPSLTQATGGPEPLSPSTCWGAGSGTHWWSLIPGSPCLGSGQVSSGVLYGVPGWPLEKVQPCPQLLCLSGPLLPQVGQQAFPPMLCHLQLQPSLGSSCPPPGEVPNPAGRLACQVSAWLCAQQVPSPLCCSPLGNKMRAGGGAVIIKAKGKTGTGHEKQETAVPPVKDLGNARLSGQVLSLTQRRALSWAPKPPAL